eukprot:CAMPEP_0170494720 /NCGR_PEP_ID=MMETSP0208-20121228/14799_1 /TAXON_ID=197538 /ORGANISM="Strombidium inclinatum, Strain S3" /LENGTH=118 /DNA_ID=CAMNT_0010770809 /DNA_START=335 /DNA_END=691 /DNA_ORIENTATION=+
MLLVDPLIEWKPLGLAVDQSVGHVEAEVLDQEAKDSLLEHRPAGGDVLDLVLPGQSVVDGPRDHAESYEIDRDGVDKKLDVGFLAQLTPAFRIDLPRPGLIFFNLVLFDERKFESVQE